MRDGQERDYFRDVKAVDFACPDAFDGVVDATSLNPAEAAEGVIPSAMENIARRDKPG